MTKPLVNTPHALFVHVYASPSPRFLTLEVRLHHLPVRQSELHRRQRRSIYASRGPRAATLYADARQLLHVAHGEHDDLQRGTPAITHFEPFMNTSSPISMLFSFGQCVTITVPADRHDRLPSFTVSRLGKPTPHAPRPLAPLSEKSVAMEKVATPSSMCCSTEKPTDQRTPRRPPRLSTNCGTVPQLLSPMLISFISTQSAHHARHSQLPLTTNCFTWLNSPLFSDIRGMPRQPTSHAHVLPAPRTVRSCRVLDRE